MGTNHIDHKTKLIEKFWRNVPSGLPDDACWEWLGRRDASGYGVLYYGGVNYRAHRLAITIGRGQKLPDGGYACHHCDNPPCVNPSHLYAGTPKTNAQDVVIRSRRSNVLLEDHVKEMRYLYWREHMEIKHIAARFGVRYERALGVINNTSYSHIDWHDWVQVPIKMGGC